MKLSGILLIIGVSLSIVFLLGVFLIPQPETMPDDLGYRYKFFKEATQRVLIFDDIIQSQFELEVADRRLTELEYEFERREAPSYTVLGERYEQAMLLAANESKIADEIIEVTPGYVSRMEIMRDTVWDPPLQEFFDRLRINTIRAQRQAIDFTLLDDHMLAAKLSLAGGMNHLDNAYHLEEISRVDAELERYEGWLDYHRGLHLRLEGEGVPTGPFENATLEELPEHLQIIESIALRPSRRLAWRTDHVRFNTQEVRDVMLHVVAQNETNATEAEVEEEEVFDPYAGKTVLELTIRDYEADPAEVVAQEGDWVVLRIRAGDRRYAMSSSSIGMGARNVIQGATHEFNFNATQRGVFMLRCIGFCPSIGYGAIRVE